MGRVLWGLRGLRDPSIGVLVLGVWVFSFGRENNGKFEQFKFNKNSVDAQFPLHFYSYVPDYSIICLSSGQPKWSCLTIKSFLGSWSPNFLYEIPGWPWGEVNKEGGGECRGGDLSLPKATVCHHPGKTVWWDLVALVLMYIFPTNSLFEKAVERLGALWMRASMVRMIRKQRAYAWKSDLGLILYLRH